MQWLFFMTHLSWFLVGECMTEIFPSVLRVIYGTQTLFFGWVLQLPLLDDLPGLATNPLSPLDWSIRRISIGGGFRYVVVFLYGIGENMYQLIFKIDQHAPNILFLVALGWILKPPTMWLVFYWGHRLSASCPVKRAEPAGMKKHKDPWIQWANHRHITDPTPTSL